MLGNQCVKTHRQTQETISSSSGKSEFYGIVQVATLELGVKGLLDDVGGKVKAQVNTDSSAAKSIASKRCAGRVRHIEVRELWVQDRLAKGALSIVKVECEEYVADGLTKHVDRQKMDHRVEACSMVRWSGRLELCPRFGNGK